MAINLTYKMLQNDIIKSYVSGDFDNLLNQLDMSLGIFSRLYNEENFQDVKTFVAEKVKLFTAVQEMVDQQLFKELYGD